MYLSPRTYKVLDSYKIPMMGHGKKHNLYFYTMDFKDERDLPEVPHTEMIAETRTWVIRLMFMKKVIPKVQSRSMRLPKLSDDT